MDEVKISAILLTKNEEKKIETCLLSVKFCDEIIVVDDNSTDSTVSIAKKYTDKVVIHKLNNDFTQQRNFAMTLAKNDWILFVDADEEVSIDLHREILKTLSGSSNKQAYYIPRRDFWWGKEIKYGDVSFARQKGFIRLVKKHSGKWMGKVHERFMIKSLAGTMKSFLNHYPHPTVKEFILDINYYSTLRAHELHEQHVRPSILQVILFPLGKFIVNYFLNLGILDGAAGFAYAFFMSFHSFLVRAKLYQYSEFPDTYKRL